MTEYSRKFTLVVIDPQEYQLFDFLEILYDKFHLMHHIAVWHDPSEASRSKHVNIFLRFNSEFSTIALKAVARCFFDRCSLDPVPLVSVPCFLRSTFLNNDRVIDYFTDDMRWFNSCLACDPSLKEVIENV